MDAEEPAHEPCWADLLDDRLLGHVFLLAGKDQRQCQAVCRRWRSVWFTCPGLWCILRICPIRSVDSQLPIVKRVAPLVERLEVTGTDAFKQADSTQQWSVAAMLACFPAGRRQRLHVFRLSTQTYQPVVDRNWELHSYKSLTAADLRQLGRLRALRALELHSWQLPHCTAEVLGRLTQLSRLRLRARQLPPGCLPGAINERLKQLVSLELETTMAHNHTGMLELTMLSSLTHLEVRQANPVNSLLLLPPLDQLPRLASVQFQNKRGCVVVCMDHLVEHVELLQRGRLAFLSFYQYIMRSHGQACLASLLSSLVPPGVTLDRLQACKLKADHIDTLLGCTHLHTLRSLAVNGLFCGGGSRAAALRLLLEQTRGLTELRLNICLGSEERGWHVLCPVFEGLTALRRLNLAHNKLDCADAAPSLLRVEHLDLTCCDLKRFPGAAVLSAPLLRTLSLAGNCDMVLTREDIGTLGMVPCLQALDLRGVDIRPTEAILLGRSLPGMQLTLDSAEERWDPEYSPPAYMLEEMAWDGWQQAEDGRQGH